MGLGNMWPFVSNFFHLAKCFSGHPCHNVYQVLLFFIAESVSTLNISSGDKTGKSGGGRGKKSFPPLQICPWRSPVLQSYPKSSFPQGIHQGWVVWLSSQAAGRKCLPPCL